MEAHLGLKAEAGSYNSVKACLESTLAAAALELMVTWAMQMDSEERSLWRGRF